VEGVHFKISRQLVIPANSSFGEMEVEILNPGAQAGVTSRDLLLVLNGAEGIDRSVNYSIIGLRIAQ
jgi:lipid-binding SYLF domain-containing protein